MKRLIDLGFFHSLNKIRNIKGKRLRCKSSKALPPSEQRVLQRIEELPIPLGVELSQNHEYQLKLATRWHPE